MSEATSCRSWFVSALPWALSGPMAAACAAPRTPGCALGQARAAVACLHVPEGTTGTGMQAGCNTLSTQKDA